MKYTSKTDRDQIKKAFKMLLVEHDLNLYSFCRTFGYSYHTIDQKFRRNSIPHDLINEMVHRLDKSRNLQRINKRLVISSL